MIMEVVGSSDLVSANQTLVTKENHGDDQQDDCKRIDS